MPKFRGAVENKMLWQLAACFTQVEEVWSLMIDSIKTTDNWIGWLLTYFTQHCTHINAKQSRIDPFKSNQIRTISQLLQKVPQHRSRGELLNEVEGIRCITINYFDESNIDHHLLAFIQK